MQAPLCDHNHHPCYHHHTHLNLHIMCALLAASAHLVTAAAADRHAATLEGVCAALTASMESRLSQQPPCMPLAQPPAVPALELVAQLCCPPEHVLVDHYRTEGRRIREVSAANAVESRTAT